MRKTINHLLAEYGAAAVVVYFAIFFAVLGGFWVAIRTGWRPTSAVGSAGAFTAAYLATKVTQPLRIAATVVLTPILVRAWERVRGGRRDATSPEGTSPETTSPDGEPG